MRRARDPKSSLPLSRSSLLLLVVLLPPLLSAIAGCATSEEITRKIAHGYPEGRFPEHLIWFGHGFAGQEVSAGSGSPTMTAARAARC